MRKSIIIGIMVAVILAAAAFLVISYTQKDNSHVVSLPSPAAESSGGFINDGVDRIEVNPKTVKTALGTLVRPESFSRSYTVKSVWDGGHSEETLNYWQSGENIRLSISKNKTVRNILVRGSDLYVWYDGSSGVFQSKLGESTVAEEVDRFSGLITYEYIMDIPQEDIIDAYYIAQSGQPCIYVEYKSGTLDYVNQLFVAIDTGLLVSASKYDGGKLIYSMESVSTELSTPSESVFDVP
ncbi:MAG: hypothetical protein CVU91_10250 [Firmicutes bacterium HGW-Firmicutes-16]|nr:MAG: hypothetical protein CVU91_10250 [Firmicutes bacterium HGW-Firmicutes-16]